MWRRRPGIIIIPLPLGATVGPEYSLFDLWWLFSLSIVILENGEGFVTDLLPRGEGVEQRPRGNKSITSIGI